MIDQFATRLLGWYDEYGRKNLPWHRDADPYKIWLSEIMLQQTQVTTVIPYFERFLIRFPSVNALAEAPQDEVMHHWSGLGYYARARNLQAAAQKVVNDHAGIFPSDIESLMSLPGIGRSTAAAIRAQAFGMPSAILDGNVKRVLARLSGETEWPGQKPVETRLWALSEALLPDARARDYTQAIMDFGATQCVRRKPLCALCLFADDCQAYKEGMTASIPASKSKKQKPIKQTILLVIENPKNQLLLQKRPSLGIWGGLWSFPEVSGEADIQSRLHELGIDAPPEQVQWLAPGRHSFSHYHLDYQPALIKADKTELTQIAENDQWLWYSKNNPDSNVGLPAPIAALIEQLTQRTSP